MTGKAGRMALPAPPRDLGFTLIEVLVSLMILVLILSFIPGTLRLGKRVWEMDESIGNAMGHSAFQRYIEIRLMEALPIFFRDGNQRLYIEFSGDPDQLSFVAPAPAGPAGGGIYRYELKGPNTARGASYVVLGQSLYRTGSPSAGAGRKDSRLPSLTHTAPTGIGQLGLRYFGVQEAGKAPEWRSRWSRQDAMPDLVEITFDRPGGAVWRSIVPLNLKPAQ